MRTQIPSTTVSTKAPPPPERDEEFLESVTYIQRIADEVFDENEVVLDHISDFHDMFRSLSKQSETTREEGHLSLHIRNFSEQFSTTNQSSMVKVKYSPGATSGYDNDDMRQPMLQTIFSTDDILSKRGSTYSNTVYDPDAKGGMAVIFICFCCCSHIAPQDIREVRLNLWCVVFWIFSVAELTYYCHLAHANGGNTELWIYVASDIALFLGVLATLNSVYLQDKMNVELTMTNLMTLMAICKLEVGLIQQFKVIGGALFVIGGILHLVATTLYVESNCADRECILMHFGCDFMAEFLSLMFGLDVLTSGLGRRVHRVIAYCGILAACTIMIGTVWKDENSMMDEGLRGSVSGIGVIGFWMTGVVAAFLFVILSLMVLLRINEHDMKRNHATHTVNATIGFILLHSAGLLLYALPGYQVLLMLSTSAFIAYEMLFM